MSFQKLALLPFFLILFQFAPAQKTAGHGLTVKGIVTNGEQPLNDARIRIYNGKNQLIEEDRSRRDGSFRLRLGLNGYYVIEFTKEGMVHKRLLFKTHTPQPRKAYHPFDLEIVLFEKDLVEDNEKGSIDLDMPLGIIKYSEEKEDFDYVKDYTRKRLKEQKELLTKNEQ